MSPNFSDTPILVRWCFCLAAHLKNICWSQIEYVSFSPKLRGKNYPKNHWTLLWRGLTLYSRVPGSPNHQSWDPMILRVRKNHWSFTTFRIRFHQNLQTSEILLFTFDWVGPGWGRNLFHTLIPKKNINIYYIDDQNFDPQKITKQQQQIQDP